MNLQETCPNAVLFNLVNELSLIHCQKAQVQQVVHTVNKI